MKTLYQNSLLKKISFLVVLVLLVIQITQIVTFEFFLKKNFEDKNIVKLQNTIGLIRNNIKNTQFELQKGIEFLNNDENILASIYFINNYQDKNNYNSALLDEEKKEYLKSF